MGNTNDPYFVSWKTRAPLAPGPTVMVPDSLLHGHGSGLLDPTHTALCFRSGLPLLPAPDFTEAPDLLLQATTALGPFPTPRTSTSFKLPRQPPTPRPPKFYHLFSLSLSLLYFPGKETKAVPIMLVSSVHSNLFPLMPENGAKRGLAFSKFCPCRPPLLASTLARVGLGCSPRPSIHAGPLPVPTSAAHLGPLSVPVPCLSRPPLLASALACASLGC